MGSVKWYFKRQEKAEAPVDVEAVLAEIKTFQFQPKISVAVPVYNVEENGLQRASLLYKISTMKIGSYV